MLSQVVTGACLEAQIMQQPVAIASLKPDGWLVHIYTNLKQYGDQYLAEQLHIHV